MLSNEMYIGTFIHFSVFFFSYFLKQPFKSTVVWQLNSIIYLNIYKKRKISISLWKPKDKLKKISLLLILRIMQVKRLTQLAVCILTFEIPLHIFSIHSYSFTHTYNILTYKTRIILPTHLFVREIVCLRFSSFYANQINCCVELTQAYKC